MDEADYLFLAADEPAANAIVEEILAGPARGATRVRALVHRALAQTEARAAVDLLEAAVVERIDDPILEARTLAQLAWQRGAWLGDVSGALPIAERAVRAAERTGDDAVTATALTTQALLLSVWTGEGARERFERAVELLAHSQTEPGDHAPHIAFAHERWWRGDYSRAGELLAVDRQRATDAGDDGVAMRVELFTAELDVRRGHWDEAARHLEGALVDARGYWRLTSLCKRSLLLARRGDPAALVDAEELGSAQAGFDPIFGAFSAFARGVAAQHEGRLAEAADLMAVMPETIDGVPSRAVEYACLIPEAVTALARAGQLDRARVVAGQLDRRMRILEPWGRGALDSCHGVIALAEGDLDTARARLEAAVDLFESLESPWDLGQALLALGRTLRRAGRRTAAAAALDRAGVMFHGLGAAPAAAAVADELRRARPRRRSDDRLTDAEVRVAELASAGQTNREIAATLFTGTTTVEAHLTRIYSKLGIRSRTELARRVSDGTIELHP